MTRVELLRILIGQARDNGFEFRRWYASRLDLPWINSDAALAILETQRRYYALLFSHEFASTFWKPGSTITFQVKASSSERLMPDGSVRTVHSKPFMRRSSRRDSWRYHLRQMALAEEPLRYMLRYLHVEEEEIEEPAEPVAPPVVPQKPEIPRPLQLARSAAERRAAKLKAEAAAAAKAAAKAKRAKA